jgi:excisionase family DNA binding protein
MVTTGARGANPRQYLTRSEVARLFEVSPATVARWTREGKLPFILTLGGQRRYLLDQISDLVRRSRESPASSFGGGVHPDA